MSDPHPTTPTRPDKPAKPRPDFSLFAHAAGLGPRKPAAKCTIHQVPAPAVGRRRRAFFTSWHGAISPRRQASALPPWAERDNPRRDASILLAIACRRGDNRAASLSLPTASPQW